MDAQERTELADMVAQAVIDRLEERRQVNMLVEMVLHRINEFQSDEVSPVTPTLAQQNSSVTSAKEE